MRILFVYFPEPPSRDQQSARFQSNYLYEESVQDWVPVLLHTHTRMCLHFLCFTSNFPLCNKQVLNPALSHLEWICLPCAEPSMESFFEAREASTLFPYLRLWLSKAVRHVLQSYWTWVLKYVLKCWAEYSEVWVSAEVSSYPTAQHCSLSFLMLKGVDH